MTAIETHEQSETGRPLRADARRNRERILESALAAFAERGPDAQIDDVARHAGVGVGTVYRHFPTKEALLTELVRQKFRLFADRALEALEALEAGGEPFAALEGLMRQNAASAADDMGLKYAIASAGEEAWTQARAEREELIGLTAELLERARRAGTIRPDIEATDIAMLMCGVCTSMGPRPGFDWRRHLDLVVDVLRPRG
ncbi:MAG: TetR/AcrR family transcriptional regulator [Acidobacteriota bacterium]|nr:TetR/AcrR family transcriptional regulator [Acidobacteriota bacterium]